MTTWTLAGQQVETWTSEAPVTIRPFDPFGFDRTPRFDTGSSAGVWDDKVIQTETWTAE